MYAYEIKLNEERTKKPLEATPPPYRAEQAGTAFGKSDPLHKTMNQKHIKSNH